MGFVPSHRTTFSCVVWDEVEKSRSNRARQGPAPAASYSISIKLKKMNKCEFQQRLNVRNRASPELKS